MILSIQEHPGRLDFTVWFYRFWHVSFYMWYLVICQEHFSLYWTFVVTKENVKFYIYISIYVNFREQFSKCSRFCQSHGSKQGDSIMHLQWSTDKWAPCTAMTLYISEISCGFPSFKHVFWNSEPTKDIYNHGQGIQETLIFHGKSDGFL